MTIIEKGILLDIRLSMKARTKEKTIFLKTISNEVYLVNSRAKVLGKTFTDDDVILCLRKLMKNAEEMNSQFEINILNGYLPQLMSKEQINEKLEKLFESSGLEKSMKSMGKLMGLFNKEYKGKADNKLVSKLVKDALNA